MNFLQSVPYSHSGYQGCSTHCRTLPVVLDGKVIVSSHHFPVISGLMKDADIGIAVLFPEYVIPEHLLLYELPNGKQFEKRRVFCAGMLKDAWVRVR